MRDEYKEEPGGFSPVKFGLIGALIVAAVVGCILWVQSQNRTIEALQNQQAASSDELQKTKKEKDDVQNQLDELKQTAAATSTQYKKQLQQRESQLSTVKREKEQENQAAEEKLEALKKEKSAAETQIAQMKKDVETKTQALKQLQEQIGKGQADLQKVRAEYDRAQKNYAELQRKIQVIDDGDQAAADMMVQQLAETRRQLKEEQEARKKLEQQLAATQNPQ
jgi:chromosome segregation ATPase